MYILSSETEAELTMIKTSERKIYISRVLLRLVLFLEIEAKYEKKMRTLREELELRRKTEIHEIEERKNSQINSLMKNHEKAFSDIKNYYNDITLNNLALINSLKVGKYFLYNNSKLFPSVNLLCRSN